MTEGHLPQGGLSRVNLNSTNLSHHHKALQLSTGDFSLGPCSILHERVPGSESDNNTAGAKPEHFKSEVEPS